MKPLSNRQGRAALFAALVTVAAGCRSPLDPSCAVQRELAAQPVLRQVAHDLGDHGRGLGGTDVESGDELVRNHGDWQLTVNERRAATP